MGSYFLSRRRGPLVITIAILKAAKNGVGKVQVLYSVGLNYERLNRHLEFLKANGFVEEYGNLYETTGKGLELIEEFEPSPLTRSILIT